MLNLSKNFSCILQWGAALKRLDMNIKDLQILKLFENCHDFRTIRSHGVSPAPYLPFWLASGQPDD
jgi:hypothetical protein